MYFISESLLPMHGYFILRQIQLLGFLRGRNVCGFESDSGDCDRSQMKILASRRILYGSGRRFALADASGPLM